ncbi:MAG: hypothetical protein Q9160_007266 [Pyrenula sp. 1 TL-2023]
MPSVELEAETSTPSRSVGRRTIKPPQNRYLDETVPADQAKPKRKKYSRRGVPPDIRNNPEKWRLTDLQRATLENSSRHVDPKEYAPSVYDCIIRQRAIDYAIENELKHGRRRDGIYLLMATNSVPEMQNRHFSSLERLEFIKEMEELKEKMNIRLRDTWMFWGLRAGTKDIAKDDEYTLEQANARRAKEEVNPTIAVDENGGHQVEAATPATVKEEETSQGYFEVAKERFVKLRLTLNENKYDVHDAGILEDGVTSSAELESNQGRAKQLRLTLKKEIG